MKPPVGSFPDPVTGQEVATKAWTENLSRQTASGDYIYATLSGDQDLGVSASLATVLFDTVDVSRGDLTLVAGQVNLLAGRTYLIQAAIRLQHTVAASRSFFIWDDTASVSLGATPVLRTVNETASLSSQPSISYVFTPTQDTLIELRAGSGTDNVDADSQASWFQVIEIGATVVNAVGGLEFMDVIEVVGDTQSVSFGASGDGALLRALDGDTDEEYLISYYIPDPGASILLDLRPNAAAATYEGSRHYAGSGHISANHARLGLAGAASGFTADGWAELKAQTGKARGFYSRKVLNGGGTRYVIQNAGIWTDTATNITSLEIRSDVAATIKIGAVFKLWRRTSNSVRADSASIYERNVEATVAQGTNSEVEYSMGRATYQGSAIGVSVDLDDTVTAGSITVNMKISGVTKLTATLDTTDTFFARDVALIGTHAVAPGDQLVIGLSTTGLTTTGGGSPGITVNTTVVNDAMVASTIGLLDSQNTYTKAQTVSPSALAYGANIAVDASLSNVFTVTLTGTTAQLDNPTNLTAGQTIVIMVTQDPTGGRAMTFGTNWDFGADGAPDLTTEAADALSLISGVTDGTKIFVSSKLGFVA